ncbi:MAG: LamG-like jellyroll fold domain-containing protein [Candidatus Bathyarchaeia archaeon]|jgi:hypothetical protein
MHLSPNFSPAKIFLMAVMMLVIGTCFMPMTASAQGYALSYNYTQVVRAAVNPINLNGDLTVEAWINPFLTSEVMKGKIHNQRPSLDGMNMILVYVGDPGFNGCGFLIHYNGSNMYVEGLLGGVEVLDSTVTVTNGNWYHLALVQSSGNWTFYVNGIGYAFGNISSNGLNIGDSLNIGNGTSGTQGFSGTIDEVRISTVARYSSNFTPPGAPFVTDANTWSLYHFDEGTGDTTADASGNGRTGYLGAPPSGRPSWVASDAPLPIQLASFTAGVVNSDKVKLEWSTVSETNTYGFYVERRPQTSGTFATVSSLIPGAGTSLKEHSYSWIDSTVTAGSYLYRVRQVGLTGSVSYSQSINVDVVLGVNDQLAPQKFQLLQSYPNPFNPSTTISYQLPKQSYVNLKVFDVLGREVATLVKGEQTAGYKSVTWNAANVPSGIYFYRLQAGSFIETRKLLLLK